MGRAKHFAKKLGAKLAIIDKRRPRPNVAEVFNVIGDVDGPDLRPLRRHGRHGRDPRPGRRGPDQGRGQAGPGLRTHPVLSGPAIEQIEASPIEQLIVTNTIPLERSQPGLLARSSSCRWPSSSARPSGGSTRAAP